MKEGGNALSTGLTAGAFSTSGKGWAQGGSIDDVVNDKLYGIPGKLKAKNQVDVPGAIDKPTFDLGSNGQLRSDLQLGASMPASFDQSQDVLNKLQGDAMAVGPSQSAQYLQQANTRNTQNSLGQADALGASSLAGMTNGLAMRGGLDAGSRERMGKSTGFETLMNKQKVLNDSAGNNLQILSDDEKQKKATLQALPANLLAQAGMAQSNKQFDISNTLNTFGNKYNQDMSIYGGNQTAIEQAKLANKNSGMFGLGIGGL